MVSRKEKKAAEGTEVGFAHTLYGSGRSGGPPFWGPQRDPIAAGGGWLSPWKASPLGVCSE